MVDLMPENETQSRLLSPLERACVALNDAGLHVCLLTDQIANVHSAPVTSDSDQNDETYLFTITVTVTP